MTYSENCIKLIKNTRQLFLIKTLLWNERYSIGYSHPFNLQSNSDSKITKKGAIELLHKDLSKIAKQLNKYLSVELNQNQFDSLISLIYDIGIKRFISDEILSLINGR